MLNECHGREQALDVSSGQHLSGSVVVREAKPSIPCSIT